MGSSFAFVISRLLVCFFGRPTFRPCPKVGVLDFGVFGVPVLDVVQPLLFFMFWSFGTFTFLGVLGARTFEVFTAFEALVNFGGLAVCNALIGFVVDGVAALEPCCTYSGLNDLRGVADTFFDGRDALFIPFAKEAEEPGFSLPGDACDLSGLQPATVFPLPASATSPRIPTVLEAANDSSAFGVSFILLDNDVSINAETPVLS
mmetsp:Transcript_28065/g.38952  ORF Transcript_28065/g.38952 Transcript_28065/m.38952 type:complete len:204 (-) Transcript_28065:735-1346(-)